MKSIFVSLFVLVVSNLMAQTNAITGTPMRVYKTYADVIANKPVEGVEVTNDNAKVDRKAAVVLKDHGTEKTIAADKMTYYAYTDKSGLFIRPSEDKFYYVLVLGKYSYYYCTCEGDLNIYNGKLVGIASNGVGKSFYQYTSEGTDGKIEYTGQMPRQVLKDEPELQAAYKKELPKAGFPGYSEDAEREVIIKYLKLYNEKKAKG
jgi:hypothetical protein